MIDGRRHLETREVPTSSDGSILKRSPLWPHLQSGDYEQARDVFDGELAEALTIAPFGKDFPFRREDSRPFILKVLLFIGLPPGVGHSALLAHMIETLSSYPEIELGPMLKELSEQSGFSISALERIIDKEFSPYDREFLEKVEYLTRSHLVTAKDVLVDLAQYVRMVMLAEGIVL